VRFENVVTSKIDKHQSIAEYSRSKATGYSAGLLQHCYYRAPRARSVPDDPVDERALVTRYPSSWPGSDQSVAGSVDGKGR